MKINPINYSLGKYNLNNFEEGNKYNYLLSNGLGGFSSLTSISSCARCDHGLLIAAKVAPNFRTHLVNNVDDFVTINNKEYKLSSQEFANKSKNYKCDLLEFSFCYLPKWVYQIEGLEIIKELVFIHNTNTVIIRYKVYSHQKTNAKLSITPLLRLTNKDDFPKSNNTFVTTNTKVTNKETKIDLHYSYTGTTIENIGFDDDLFFSYDSRDGRTSIGKNVKQFTIENQISKEFEEFYVVFSDKRIKSYNEYTVDKEFEKEINRQKKLIQQSNIEDPYGQSLVIASDKYISKRDSTNGKTIMAGFPFFADWGRDTMIAMIGCTISTKRFEDAKSIFRTFKEYEKDGMMPNMFPEGNSNPLYNTVDASLLFFEALYKYYEATKDLEFIKEMYSTMQNIIKFYKQGTSFHIKMEDDYLISAGSDLEQLTWMDIRFGDILPTPRHGKPVEINAYWYNALIITDKFAKLLNIDEEYTTLANYVKDSFISKFYNKELKCLRDVLSNTKADNQIRLNQVWALSISHTMISDSMAEEILGTIYSRLFTPYGLRSLCTQDAEFKANYGGSHYNRDMSYHQGTVWAFPLGAYYLALLKYFPNKKEMVSRLLSYTKSTLFEGSLGQIAEIFDGLTPNYSRGCFAQAWSVSEILRVYEELQKD